MTDRTCIHGCLPYEKCSECDAPSAATYAALNEKIAECLASDASHRATEDSLREQLAVTRHALKTLVEGLDGLRGDAWMDLAHLWPGDLVKDLKAAQVALGVVRPLEGG